MSISPLVLHYTHDRSSRPHAILLLFSRSWPGSFVRVVDPLTMLDNTTDPAFDLVAPSIPGFGCSPAPMKSGLGPKWLPEPIKSL